jgi:hypothetical protein
MTPEYPSQRREVGLYTDGELQERITGSED